VAILASKLVAGAGFEATAFQQILFEITHGASPPLDWMNIQGLRFRSILVNLSVGLCC